MTCGAGYRRIGVPDLLYSEFTANYYVRGTPLKFSSEAPFMNFLHEAISDTFEPGSPGSRPDTNHTVTLDITYDDPELQALISVASSKWASENLRDSLKQGRVTNDLWALGLPTPDAVTSVYITDNQYLCVQAVVTCDELVDLSSVSDPTNKYHQQLKIKRITIMGRKTGPIDLEHHSRPDELSTISTASIQDPMGISPITTVLDYYRRFHLGEENTTPPPVHATLPFTPLSVRGSFRAGSEPVDNLAGMDVSRNSSETLETRSFCAELKLGLQSRRLRDAQHELQKLQAQVDRLTAQLREQELEPALVRAKIGDGGEVPARHNDVHEQVDLEESSIGDKDVARVDTSEPSSCIRCEIRSQSAKLSLLHLRTMEFRVTMSERRQIETESHAARLLDALQSERRVRLQLEAELVAERRARLQLEAELVAERRVRLQLEAELVAERQKRRGAETVGEAIANEATWPFVMPDMLDVFLKLEGMVEEVGREGKEG